MLLYLVEFYLSRSLTFRLYLLDYLSGHRTRLRSISLLTANNILILEVVVDRDINLFLLVLVGLSGGFLLDNFVLF